MIKLVAISILFAIIVFFLKNLNSDLFIPALVCSGVVILSFGIGYLSETITFFSKIIQLTNLDDEYFKIILKILGIAYIIEFGAGTIEDIGYKSLAEKLVFVGKILIFLVSMPIFYAIFNLIGNLSL